MNRHSTQFKLVVALAACSLGLGLDSARAGQSNIEPVADSYVRDGGSADSNFATSTGLSVKNTGVLDDGYNRITYLKFDVQGLTGEQNVRLILTPCQVDGYATLSYEWVTNNAWTETGITWNNQPGGSGVIFATVTGYTVGTPVTVDVTDAAMSQAANDGYLSIRVIGAAGNNVRVDFASREHPTSSWHPVLQLTEKTCYVDTASSQQTIDGFGFSSAWCGTLPAAKNNALYNTLGMSLLRIRIDPNQNWSAETANAAAAHAAGAKVLGSPWTPPASMKDNNDFVHGSLLESQYANYANYLNQAISSHGLDYVAIQNEPDWDPDYEGCTWTGAQLQTFCASNAQVITKPVVMPESLGFYDSMSDPTLNDPAAASHVSIVAGHFYGNGNYVHTNALAHGKHVWQTEHFIDDTRTNMANCIKLAREISDSMNNQFSAYFWWWVNDGDNENLVLNDGTIFKNGYTIGQFAKWIRPGMVRCGATYNPAAGIFVTAYRGDSSGLVLVAINTGAAPASQTFAIQNTINGSVFVPYRTSETESMTKLADVNVTNDTFSCTLPAQSVTTFVQRFPKLAGTIIGTAASSSTYGLSNVFDGNLNTYFNASSRNGAWVGLDFGAGVTNVITQINYCPRSGHESRMVNGSFQGANNASFTSAVTLYTITAQPASGVFTSAAITNTTAFRYVRYLSPKNSYGNVSELEFYGYRRSSTPAPSAPTGLVAAPASTNQINLAWNAGSNATSYKVKRSTSNGGLYAIVATGVTATNYSDTGLAAATTYYYVVSGVNAGGESTNSAQASATTLSPAPDSLVHRYSFGESGGTTVADSVGGPAWAGTLPNGSTLSGGQLALASASQQYASLPAGIVGSLSNCTIMAWVNLNSVSDWSRIFDFGSGTTANMFLTPQCGGSRTLRFAITINGGGSEQQINCGSTLSTGVWHQVAVSLSSGNGILYLDGVAVGTNSSMTQNPLALGSTSNNYLGKSQYPDPYLDGSLDEFRIYNVGLSSSEIAATYASPRSAQMLTPSAPLLSLVLAGTNLTVSWPVAYEGFTLQTRTNLTLGGWMNVTSPVPQIANGQWQVSLPPPSGIRSIFYRLSK